MTNLKPMLFSAPMVRAILDDCKTVTRRVLKPQPQETAPNLWHVFNRGGGCVNVPTDQVCDVAPDYAPIQSGDTLWVREAWRALCEYDDMPPRLILNKSPTQYMADKPLSPWLSRGRAPIHMPRWASRIDLRVTGVKVERLQDISENDARCEGVQCNRDTLACTGHLTYISAFKSLWNQINGPDAWNANPWVVAYTFERIQP